MNTHDLRAAMDELAREVPEPDSDYATDAWRQGRRSRRRYRWTVTLAAAAAVAAIGAATWLTGLLSFSNDDQYLGGNGESQPFATYHGREHPADVDLVANISRVTFKNGCIRFSNAPLLLPEDTIWDPEGQELSLDGHTLRIGKQIISGGAYVAADPAYRIPDSCRDEQFTKTKTLFQMGTLEHSDKID